MGALFTDLHDVAQVLTEHIREVLGIADVQPGAPRVTTGPTPGARITLLYTTPQPNHRNDPEETQPDGTRRPPPCSLSCFYLITTSGEDSDDPIAAHAALGQIMTLYHDSPTLQLPLDVPGFPPGTFTPLGDGLLRVVQVPMVLEQIDKIWTSVEPPLQPWALYEVAPVQLVSTRPDVPPGPLVRPGGIGLGVSTMASRPRAMRVTPPIVRPGGRVRIDVAPAGAIEGLAVGAVEVPVGHASLIDLSDRGSVILTLDDGGLEGLGEGQHRLAVRARGLVSRREVLHIAAPSAPTVDAPDELAHDLATDLVLDGANLGDSVEAIVWPDAGLVSPSDVHSLAVVGVASTSVTVPAVGLPVGLSALLAKRGPWRLVIRVGAHLYTPFVLLEPAV